jgi:hypothetical protein
MTSRRRSTQPALAGRREPRPPGIPPKVGAEIAVKAPLLAGWSEPNRRVVECRRSVAC